MDDNQDFEAKLADFEKYLKSPENKKICEPFQRECQRFAALAESYQDAAVSLRGQAQEKVVREEFSVKGEVLSRGFYAPNPVVDIVTGCCNRGKLLKRVTPKSKITFRYGFDRSDRLTVAEYRGGAAPVTEILLYQNEDILGITLSSDDLITQLCEEKYENGRIVSLSRADFIAETNEVFQYCHEDFVYDQAGIKSCDFYEYTPDMPYLRHRRCYFEHDADGFISSYTSEEFDGEVPKQSCWDGHAFEVRIRRKF